MIWLEKDVRSLSLNFKPDVTSAAISIRRMHDLSFLVCLSVCLSARLSQKPIHCNWFKFCVEIKMSFCLSDKIIPSHERYVFVKTVCWSVGICCWRDLVSSGCLVSCTGAVSKSFMISVQLSGHSEFVTRWLYLLRFVLKVLQPSACVSLVQVSVQCLTEHSEFVTRWLYLLRSVKGLSAQPSVCVSLA